LPSDGVVNKDADYDVISLQTWPESFTFLVSIPGN